MIPIGDRCHVILAFEKPLLVYADLLNCNFQILLKSDGIQNMPTVKSPHGRHIVIVVQIMDGLVMAGIVGIAHVWRAVRVLDRLPVPLSRKAPGTAEIIFSAGAADGRILPIAVDIHLDLALSPPIAFQCGKCHVGSDVLAAAFDVVEKDIILRFIRDPLPLPLRVKVGRIIRQLVMQAIINLIEEGRN
ncbi:hypothetical protein D3C73_1032890 [compost metagenome]